MIHGILELRREFDASRAQVWTALSDLEQRKRWRRVPGVDSTLEMDFREGGYELLTGTFAPSGRQETIRSYSRFVDVIEQERYVFYYDFVLDGVRCWSSQVTIELDGNGDRTLLRHTEQYVFLSWTGDGGNDVAHLRGGLNLAYNALLVVLRSQT